MQVPSELHQNSILRLLNKEEPLKKDQICLLLKLNSNFCVQILKKSKRVKLIKFLEIHGIFVKLHEFQGI